MILFSTHNKRFLLHLLKNKGKIFLGPNKGVMLNHILEIEYNSI